MKHSAFSKVELDAWEKYDQTFTDPLDDKVVSGFKDLVKDAEMVDGWAVASFGGKTFERVGNGTVTNDSCGKYGFGTKVFLSLDYNAGSSSLFFSAPIELRFSGKRRYSF